MSGEKIGAATASKYTPGPWAIRKISDRLYGVNDAKGIAVADLHAVQGRHTAANARLIAAAPDLLKEHTEACDAADHILALMTMEFGRLMVEGPDEEIEVTMCGHTVRIPAHYFNRLYNATSRKSIAKATGGEA